MRRLGSMAKKYIFSFVMIALLLSACQKQPQPNTPHTPPVLEKENHLFSCQDVEKKLQTIQSNSTVTDLEKVNEQLKLCLPQLNMSQRTSILYASTAMYQRFLTVNRTAKEQISFDDYTETEGVYPSLQEKHLKNLSERDRYLIQHQNEAYYDIYDADGQTKYRRQPRYLNEIFAPYLPHAEQVFISHLAEQNEQPILSQSTFNITWAELAERAQFWTNYVKEYPNSLFFEDAQRLKFAYTRFVFHGLPNMPISNQYIGENDIHPEALLEIKLLAQQPHSQLGQKAGRFLNFIHVSEHERDQKIPVELSPVEQRSTQKEDILENKQLDQYIGLNDPLLFDSTHISRDCFVDAICITHIGNVANKLPSNKQLF